MMVNEIDTQYLIEHDSLPLIDVRAPSEYASGHIPWAVNLPLLNDEERKQVGIAYKQKGKYQAVILGMELFGPKLSGYVKAATKISENKKLLIHCWRGGQRSAIVSWLMQNAGIDNAVLRKGYKVYRNYIHEYFQKTSFRFIVLGGKTGTGKTNILRELKKQGECVLDLENLANHKGSAFGGIGECEQETNEQFENNLFHALQSMHEAKFIWLENESKTIGRNYIPDNLWYKIKKAPLINIARNFDERVKHLVSCYDLNDKDALINSFGKIVKRIGLENYQKACEFIKVNNLEAAVGIALQYYDKCYEFNLVANQSPEIFNINYTNENHLDIARDLIQFKHKQFGS